MPFGFRTMTKGARTRCRDRPTAPRRSSAGPHRLARHVLALVLFGLFYANYVYGWIGVEQLDFCSAKPPNYRRLNLQVRSRSIAWAIAT
jgi:predicted secreted protein